MTVPHVKIYAHRLETPDDVFKFTKHVVNAMRTQESLGYELNTTRDFEKGIGYLDAGSDVLVALVSPNANGEVAQGLKMTMPSLRERVILVTPESNLNDLMETLQETDFRKVIPYDSNESRTALGKTIASYLKPAVKGTSFEMR